MWQPWGSSTTSGSLGGAADTERSDGGLGNDSTDLSRSGREAVGGGTISGREAFSGNNEGGCVGAEVEEKLSQNVKSEKGVAGKVSIGETEDAEEDRLW
jgi:hypothetical protein